MRGLVGILTFVGDLLKHPLLLFMRLFWGFGFFQAGMGKFSNIENVVNFFTSLGIPFPNVMVYLVASCELLGGLLLMIGFGSRIAAVPLIIIMSVAYGTANLDSVVNFMQNPKAFVEQQPFMYLLTSLLVLSFGPGAFSIDAIVKFLTRRKEG